MISCVGKWGTFLLTSESVRDEKLAYCFVVKLYSDKRNAKAMSFDASKCERNIET